MLKHFNWPERKADSMREAAIEFRYFKSLESEIDYFKDDASVPCDVSLRKISSLLDKYSSFFICHLYQTPKVCQLYVVLGQQILVTVHQYFVTPDTQL